MKKWSKILIVFLFLFAVLNAEVEKKPLKAAALSTLIPGGGQLYNQNYWKSGAVFILESSLIGLAVYHHLEAEKYYENYQLSNDTDDYENYLNSSNEQQSYLFWLGTIIFLSAGDAFVDAHLTDFEKKKKKLHLKFEDNILSLSYQF